MLLLGEQLFILLRRHSVFSLECPEETGIIFESTQQIRFADVRVAKNCSLTHREAFFHYILVDRQTKILFENVRNMVLAHIEFPGKPIQC